MVPVLAFTFLCWHLPPYAARIPFVGIRLHVALTYAIRAPALYTQLWPLKNN